MDDLRRTGATRLVPLRTGGTLAIEVVVPTTPLPLSGRIVVLLHGLAQQRSVWREAAEILVRQYSCTCVLPDLRGHGDSIGSATTLPHAASSFRTASAAGLADDNDVAQRYRLAQLADDLAALTAALLLPEPVAAWVGHSYGGNVLLELAARHPAVVARGSLVLVDGGFIDLQGAFPEAAGGWGACLSLLRPPSFAGMGLADLRRAVEEVWAVDAATGQRCWTDRGVQAMLDNFHTTTFDATTTTAAVATAKAAAAAAVTAGTAPATAAARPRHVFESVQPKLLFRAHMQLLEDLWARRPRAPLQALPRALLAANADQLPFTIAFVASPTPSPFSADKRADVVASIRALLQGLLSLPAPETAQGGDNDLCIRVVAGGAAGDEASFPAGGGWCEGAPYGIDADVDEAAAALRWVDARLPTTPSSPAASADTDTGAGTGADTGNTASSPESFPALLTLELRRGTVAVVVSLRWVAGVGHEMPLQAPAALARAIHASLPPAQHPP